MQFIKSIHKWTSVLVGIQLLIWLLSGFYFNIMDVSKVRGDRYQNKISPVASPLTTYQSNQSKLLYPQDILDNVTIV